VHVMAPRGVAELADAIRESRDGLRVRGAGTWLEAGHPVRASHALHLDAFRGVRDYVPADLTISVGAATTLAELNAATQPHGQWCPLLPWGSDDGSVGATIATATTGPAADALGRPRDLVLGLECVDGTGRIIRAGGRVVKNVAGFDLTRLMTGAWGTLGVLTEVHLRLRARPPVDETWLLRDADAVAVREFARGPHAPIAISELTPRLGARLGTGADGGWLVRLEGNAGFMAASRAALRALGSAAELDAGAWTVVRAEAGPPPRASQWNWSALARDVKARFDPRDVLNPGLLGARA